MNESDSPLTDEAVLNLVRALAVEVTDHGSQEAELMFSQTLTDEEIGVVMKANTFLSAFSAVLIQIVERQNPGFARLVVDTWTSDAVQHLVQLAFAEEIEKAAQEIEDSISKLEKEINKEE